MKKKIWLGQVPWLNSHPGIKGFCDDYKQQKQNKNNDRGNYLGSPVTSLTCCGPGKNKYVYLTKRYHIELKTKTQGDIKFALYFLLGFGKQSFQSFFSKMAYVECGLICKLGTPNRSRFCANSEESPQYTFDRCAKAKSSILQ